MTKRGGCDEREGWSSTGKCKLIIILAFIDVTQAYKCDNPSAKLNRCLDQDALACIGQKNSLCRCVRASTSTKNCLGPSCWEEIEPHFCKAEEDSATTSSSEFLKETSPINLGNELYRHPKTLDCVDECVDEDRNCRVCVQTLHARLQQVHQLLLSATVIPKEIKLEVYKAHPSIPDLEVGLPHYGFTDRPPQGRQNTPNKMLLHSSCPAMRARSKTTGLTVKMPYTARVCRDGRLEFVCDWIKGSPTKGWRLKEAVDSPWFRLPKSILQVFTIGDSRADVWVFNSGLYVDDLALHHGPVDRNKGGANGSRWILLPLPHRPAAQAWTIEQAILSSFERIDMRVSAYPFVDFSRLIFNTDCRNLPIQFNFSAVPKTQQCIEIVKGTPIAQFIAAALPTVSVVHTEMPDWLHSQQVEYSIKHSTPESKHFKSAGIAAVAELTALGSEDTVRQAVYDQWIDWTENIENDNGASSARAVDEL